MGGLERGSGDKHMCVGLRPCTSGSESVCDEAHASGAANAHDKVCVSGAKSIHNDTHASGAARMHRGTCTSRPLT